MAERDNDILCTQCEELTAQWQCQQCNIDMCNKCKKGHIKIPVCQDHNIQLIKKETNTRNQIQPPSCKAHNEPISVNCTTCEKMMCDSCQKDGHQNHSVEDLSKAFDNLLHKFQINGEKVEDDLWVLQEKVNLMKTNIESIKTLYLVCKESVEKRADEVIKAVCHDKDKLQELLDKQQSQEIRKLETLKQELEKDMTGCARIKGILDCKKAVLMSRLGTNLTCENNSVQMQALGVDKVVVNNPNFIPATDDPGDIPVNHIGTIEFKDVELKLRTKVKKNGIWLPDKLTKKVKLDKEIAIPSGSSFHFGVVDDDLWVPVHGEDTIMVISNSGEHKRQINVSRNQDTVWGMKSPRSWQNGICSKNTSLSAPRSVRQINENMLVVAADTGIYLMGTDGKIQSQIVSGQFCDVSLSEDKDKFAALDYGTKKCLIFKLEKEGTWLKEEEFFPRKCKVDQYGSVLLTNECVVICPGGTHVVQKYSPDGESLEEYGSYGRGEPSQLWGPSLCISDHNGNVLIADVNNKRLQVLDKENKWIVIYMEGLTYPFDVKLVDNGIWVLSQHNGSKYKLMKYVYV